MRFPTFYFGLLVLPIALAVVAGCSRVLPPAAGPPPLPRGSDEFREWVRRHQIDPGKPLADLQRELDRMTTGDRKDFDRQSQSRVGYLDIRAELDVLLKAHGPTATLGDVTRDPPGGR